jgi:hypothetical protein
MDASRECPRWETSGRVHVVKSREPQSATRMEWDGSSSLARCVCFRNSDEDGVKHGRTARLRVDAVDATRARGWALWLVRIHRPREGAWTLSNVRRDEEGTIAC